MKKTILYLIIILLSFGRAPGQTLRWNYPCKPGTECWNALTSVTERQNACQITGIDLSTLSTEELLLITMEHPFFRSYIAHDSPIEGMGFVLEGFNGFSEFKRRPDAMRALRDVYFREDFNAIGVLPDSAKMGAYSLKWIGVELIMCDEAFLSQMSSKEKVDFLRRLHSQWLVKKRYEVVFGGISNEVSAYLFDLILHSMGEEMLADHFEPDEIKSFRRRLIVRSTAPIEYLLNKFDEYVKSH